LGTHCIQHHHMTEDDRGFFVFFGEGVWHGTTLQCLQPHVNFFSFLSTIVHWIHVPDLLFFQQVRCEQKSKILGVSKHCKASEVKPIRAQTNPQTNACFPQQAKELQSSNPSGASGSLHVSFPIKKAMGTKICAKKASQTRTLHKFERFHRGKDAALPNSETL